MIIGIDSYFWITIQVCIAGKHCHATIGDCCHAVESLQVGLYRALLFLANSMRSSGFCISNQVCIAGKHCHARIGDCYHTIGSLQVGLCRALIFWVKSLVAGFSIHLFNLLRTKFF